MYPEWIHARCEPWPEIGVRLTTEQWLDLIARMQQELSSSEEVRKEMDSWRSPNVVFYISQTAGFARIARHAYDQMLKVRKLVPKLEEMPSPSDDSEAAKAFIRKKTVSKKRQTGTPSSSSRLPRLHWSHSQMHGRHEISHLGMPRRWTS